MMNPFAALDRAPKFVLFGAAGLIQVCLVAWMVIDRVTILRAGTDVMLQTRPVDPRDFLRGDYVALGYDISNLPAGAVKDPASACTGATVYVTLAPNRDGFHEAVSAHAAPVEVEAPEVLIRGHVTNGVRCGSGKPAYYGNLQVRYGLERYFVPEGEGRKLESARNQRKLAVVAAVTPTGRAAIKRLLIDGEPVYDEPWF
jgi:uncharacterized membrane-anchored protein